MSNVTVEGREGVAAGTIILSQGFKKVNEWMTTLGKGAPVFDNGGSDVMSSRCSIQVNQSYLPSHFTLHRSG